MNLCQAVGITPTHTGFPSYDYFVSQPSMATIPLDWTTSVSSCIITYSLSETGGSLLPAAFSLGSSDVLVETTDASLLGSYYLTLTGTVGNIFNRINFKINILDCNSATITILTRTDIFYTVG